MKTADFSAWLQARQARALAAMHSTEGVDFAKHCEAFQNFATASRVLWDFEVECDKAKGGAV